MDLGEPTGEELAAMLKARPTRLLVSRRCDDCRYSWSAPSDAGNCPKCHSAKVENFNTRISGLKTI